MSEKQIQKIEKQSAGIQVGRDINIGLDYRDVRALVSDLFEMNFPRIQKIAEEEARKRVQEMLNILTQVITSKKYRLDEQKISDPAFQYEMQAITIDAARRGSKCNIELLCELLALSLTKECPEIVEMLSFESRKVIPSLSKIHIKCLSAYVLFDILRCNDSNINEMDMQISKALEKIEGFGDAKRIDLEYLGGVGVTISISVLPHPSIPRYLNKICENSRNRDEEVLAYAKEKNCSNIVKLIETAKIFHQLAMHPSTEIGIFIGLLHIRDCFNYDIIADRYGRK